MQQEQNFFDTAQKRHRGCETYFSLALAMET